ncbi:MAG TPA: glycoside hydrolase family 38 C-terminal domain-containing protein, partial [Armatimonadota bacterium]|nr:glycoside hydrolase family 38 C-terminal domain-containing protein [Armatimonadota bacterium]
ARACAALENLAEPLATVAGLFGAPRWSEEQRLAWRWALQCHAHDSICGCSLDRVHRDVNQRFTHAIEFAEMIAAESLRILNGDALRTDTPRLVRYAGLGGAAGCIDFILDQHTAGNFHLRDASGNRYPVQMVATRDLVRGDFVRAEGDGQPTEDTRWPFQEVRAVAQLPAVPPCAIDHFDVVAGACDDVADPVAVTERSLENSYLRIDVNDNGTLNVQYKPTGPRYQGLLEFTDEADKGGGYRFLPLTGDTVLRSSECQASISAIEDGPLRGGLRIAFPWMLPAGLTPLHDARTGEKVECQVETTIRLEAGSATLRCHTRLHNAARDHRVRLSLPTGIQTTVVDTERAFVVAREDTAAYTAEAGQDQHAMRNWVSVADERGGLAFVGQGLHEYNLTQTTAESILNVTLLRSVPFVYDCGTWETPDAQMQGALDFTYALIFHEGDWRVGNVYHEAARFVYPAIAEVHGVERVPWDSHPHASVWLGEKKGEHEYPVSTHRSTWRSLFGHRDGWRRHDVSRLPQANIPEHFYPICIEGEYMLVSALKQAERGPDGEPDTTGDWIVRLYCVGNNEVESSVTFGFPIDAAWKSNAAEECLTPLTMVDSRRCTVKVAPFEMLTLRVRPAVKVPVQYCTH